MKSLTLKKALGGIAIVASGIAIANAAPVTINYDGVLSASGSTGVTVSATVAPILTMDIDTTSLALGTLSTSTYADQTVTIGIATNSVNGADVTMVSNGLVDSVANREIGVTDIATAPQTAGTDRYVYATDAAIGDGSAATDMAASQVVYDGTTVTSGTNTAVHIGAVIDATTEAGTYSDTLVFTATTTF